MKFTLPPLGAIERAWLWLSYQRYAFLLIGAPIAIVVGLARIAPWWVALLVGLVAIAPVRFGIEVWSRWPKKERATRIAMVRIAQGRFEPRSIKAFCGDPCFRVVAREILRRARVPRADRIAHMRQFREELRRESNVLLLIDHTTGTVTRLERLERTGT